MNISISEEKLDQVKEMLFQGDTLDASKLYQQFTMERDLTVARVAIEKLEAQLRISSPEKFTTHVQVKGRREDTSVESFYSKDGLRYPLFWKIILTFLCAIICVFLTLYVFKMW